MRRQERKRAVGRKSLESTVLVRLFADDFADQRRLPVITLFNARQLQSVCAVGQRDQSRVKLPCHSAALDANDRLIGIARELTRAAAVHHFHRAAGDCVSQRALQRDVAHHITERRHPCVSRT